MHIIYEYFRESRTSFGYNKIRIKPEKYKSGFTANAKRKKKLFVTTAIKYFGSVSILESRSANNKQNYFYFWPVQKKKNRRTSNNLQSTCMFKVKF